MKYPKYLTVALLVAALSLPAAASMPDTPAQDTPLKIKSKPQANARGCRPGSSGMTSARVTFDKSGKVTEATVISASGCTPFDREALRAARAIKFEPAKKNGVAVTTVKTVEYAYTIY